MFEGTDKVFNTYIISSFKHFLQILQDLEFTYMQDFDCDHRNFDSVVHLSN